MAEPKTVTISGARIGRNCRVSVSGYGSLTCQATALTPRLVINASDEAGGSRRAYYPFTVLNDSFILAVVHNSVAERDAFNGWVRGYMSQVSANAKISGAMKVELPVRRFVRYAVPRGTLQYGGTFDDTAFLTTLDFAGAIDPLSGVGKSALVGVSYYKPPTADPTARYFYPSGTQVSGAESLEGTIFDANPVTNTSDATLLQQHYNTALSQGLISPGVSFGDYSQLVLGY